MERIDTDADDVGYGKPPKHSQFQPGQSGNSKGRRKGSKNTATLLEEMLSEKITVREGDRTRKLSRMEAILHTQIVKALKGDPKPSSFCFRSIGKLRARAREARRTAPRWGPADTKADVRRRLEGRRKSPSGQASARAGISRYE